MALEKKRDWISCLLDYVFAACLIIECRGVWAHLEGTKFWLPRYCKIIMMAIVAAKFLAYPKSNVNIKQIIMAAAASGLLVLHAIIVPVRPIYVIKLAVMVFVISMYFILADGEESRFHFWKSYSNLICVIAAVSLFFWLFGSELRILHPSHEVNCDWGAGPDEYLAIRSYWGAYYETYIARRLGNIAIYRNYAIFIEPTMASFHFCLVYLLELCYYRKPSAGKILLLFTAVLTTVSTTGIVVVFTASVLVLLLKKGKFLFKTPVGVFFMAAVIVLAGIIVIGAIKRKLSWGSGSFRIDDFRAAYLTWREAPLWGKGIGNHDAIITHMSEFHSFNFGYSNSLGLVFADGGIFLASIFLYPFIKSFIVSVKEKNGCKFIFTMEVFVMISVTVVLYQMLVAAILVCLCLDSGKRYLDHVKNLNLFK